MRAIKTSVISILVVGLLAGTAVGVAAQDEDAMAAAAVTGTASGFTQESGGSPTLLEDFAMLAEGLHLTSTWDVSDPRLSGDNAIAGNTIRYNEHRMQVGAGDATLENDGGRWVGLVTVLEGEQLGETGTYILQGEGAYEGLTAYVVTQRIEGDPDGAQTLDAAIFPHEMTPFPEAAAAE